MILLSTSTLKWYSLHKIFKLSKETFCDWINLDLNKQEFDTLNSEYLREISILTWVRIFSLTAFDRKMSNKDIDNIIEMAKFLDVKAINFYPPHRTDGNWKWFTDYLPEAKKNNPKFQFNIISVEPKTFLFFIPEYKDATLNTIKKITWETILNVSSIDLASGFDLLKTFSVLWNSINNIFISDKFGTKSEMCLWDWEMPLESLLIKLKQWWYKWDFTIKIAPKEIWAWDDNLVIQKIKDSIEFINKYFK